MDRSPKQKITLALGRKLKEAIDYNLVGDLSVYTSYLLRWEGVCTIDWQHVAKVEVTAPGEHKLLWCNEVVGRLGLDKQAIISKFEELLASSDKGRGKGKRANVPWDV